MHHCNMHHCKAPPTHWSSPSPTTHPFHQVVDEEQRALYDRFGAAALSRLKNHTPVLRASHPSPPAPHQVLVDEEQRALYDRFGAAALSRDFMSGREGSAQRKGAAWEAFDTWDEFQPFQRK
ncbi:unnamed protein product [Closterium sp. NIES-65]|nr:unnamed protein product [Closterium sp. NIES-65]